MNQYNLFYNKSSYLCKLFNNWQTSLTPVSFIYNLQDGSESTTSLKSSLQYIWQGWWADTSLALKNSYDYTFENLAFFTYIWLHKIASPAFINETAITCQ